MRRSLKLLAVAILAAGIVYVCFYNKSGDTSGFQLNRKEAVQTSSTAAPVDSIPTINTVAEKTAEAPSPAMATPAEILARKQVPILCYHQIRDWNARDSQAAKDYIVPVERFKEQLKMLADSGYQTILPDQLFAYLATGAPLPDKPVILTFDDTNLDQYTVALPELEKHGFKGVFFIMTVSLGRPRYMSRAQVKELADAGHVIGSHTWDHQNVKKLKEQDWVTQVEKPSRQLEEITGQPVKYFAYPFGLWNKEAIPELKSRGIAAAFQLSTSRDEEEPLYTIRRLIASGHWSASNLQKKMQGSF
ncbi:polysaccharide deacetylase family protein [Pontibacter sp. SGAir0037]|uniref:polysaccharide deacetylase family protein n=1 Tax=Pontibacter sp. SGAir0037 TaxID=2571030 RepID=UPI0010CD3778|nr:polysaccharide deacetylase family protein [Pontibacter sp. SGAir0037]QCR22216.1 polysaccharide deacetylase [Pontibacter sp. SGAir0037]